MSDVVLATVEGNVGVLTVNNPPVNALSPGVPEAIVAGLEGFESDDSVKAIVLIGGGRTFIAGADIREFGKMTASGDRRRGPGLNAKLEQIENCTKPVIAAIHGAALGGGLETAMACHYRVAVRSAQVGQPEVKLGIIPGAGGTQRLPRLAGVAKALEMCTAGEPVTAAVALECGIIDQMVEGDLLAGAVEFARTKAGVPPRRARDGSAKLGDPHANAPLFLGARANARKRQRNLIAPLAAIDAIEAATTLAFDDGLKREAELFQECLFSDQSKALIHVFFAEREAAKIPGISKETPQLPVNKAAVVGAGTMGAGIAMVFANAGIPVLLKETDQAALDRGLTVIRTNYANSVKKRRFTEAAVAQNLARIQATMKYDGFAEVDMVVEAVFENMDLKKQVLSELDRVARADAILATNTSSLNIDELAAATSRPGLLIGTHFFSPANVMRLLEIVRGAATSNETVATCLALAKKLGKVGVVVGNCRGFVGNRMFRVYRREAQFLVEEGATPEAVDQALYGFGMAMGPLATGDLAGLDVGWRIRQEYRDTEDTSVRHPLLEDRLCEKGWFGQKTGIGWYKYDDARNATHNKELDQLIVQARKDAGIQPRGISADEIVERAVYGLVNEGARILEEGFALRSSDIDIVYINGYGFPSYRGGPMWYADTAGLARVYGRVCEFEKQHGKLWEPAPLLRKLAGEGKTFAEFDKKI